jgi:hypothetical protein
MQSNTKMSRRGVLGALAAAVPLAVAAPAALAASPPADGKQANGHRPECGCRRCDQKWYVDGRNPYLVTAVIVLAGAEAALERLADDEGSGQVYLDATGALWAVEYQLADLDGVAVLSDPQKVRRKDTCKPHASLGVVPAAVVALYDALDALYDLGAFHCKGDDTCYLCGRSDDALSWLRMSLDVIEDSGGEGQPIDCRADLILARRELLSVQRKAGVSARSRRPAWGSCRTRRPLTGAWKAPWRTVGGWWSTQRRC